MRLSIRDVRNREFLQCEHFADKGSSSDVDDWMSALFGDKSFGFFEIYGVSARNKEK